MDKVGFFKSIHVKIVIIYVLLILIAMQVIGVYFTKQLEDQLVDNFFEMLDERANLLAYNIEQEMKKSRDESTPTLRTDIDILLREFFSIDNAEVQVIDKNKVVLSVSNFQKRHVIGQRTTEVRVKRALLGTEDEDILRDQNTGHRMRVLAVPVKSDNETIGAIYIEASMEEIYEQMRQINQILMTGTIIALVITAALGVLLARTITRPILDMRRQAQVLGKGDFSRKVHVYGKDEIGQLAITFNELTNKLKNANATTEAEKRKLSSVLSHMTDGVIATDQEGKIILINKQAELMLNVFQEDIVGNSITDLLKLSATFELEDLIHHTDSLLLDFGDKDKEFLLEASFSVIQKEEGDFNGLITVLHDVTEQEKIEQERREFVANVSHELRTPLTSMKSYLEALEDGALHDPTIAPKFLNVAQTETERMIRLVNDLLQLSKMDSKDYRLNFDTIDVTKLVNSIIDRYELVSDSEKLAFIRNIEDQTTFATVDRDKLIQVLDNIFSNAVKYSPEGGEIRISLEESEKHFSISVSDEGVGIPEESLPQVFDRFYRVDKARSRKLGGTGLGLAIAKQIILAHGGSISVDSEWNVGTTIMLTLPYSAEKVVV
ncbi:cell wall metabolism sensor histidine kinase WalK [Anaerobacillus isosaccharinicus]|uniref:histidine kinase n=1 Tax=Anaerobacillus isosaccharinicus TaxID=1532552 RepID=A0A1S2MF94_9BACI|nr:cell wall metabolism sensor histidine kinase WalK [Anaerobacillus isosaccharinicus]MBA5584242.1 cell wall metabolism sensor histidine kinase WalK [Anaerobacillus isosaccharinicus]QOY37356.1 cell wall metabolism sensor histidine kinase WalK [Anaerobacillus isosaccharinicus]